MIWNKCPKSTCCCAKVLKTVASSVVICFNDDFYGMEDFFPKLQNCKIKNAPKKDKSRSSNSVCKSSKKGKKHKKKT